MELLQVLFSLNKTAEHVPLPGQVIISPAETSWNDFGYKIRCEFKVCISEKHKPMEGSMLIGFMAPDKMEEKEELLFYEQKETLSEHLKKSNNEVVDQEGLPPFFTLLPDMQSYRDLYGEFGRDGSELFLRSVNDLSQYKDTDAKWVKKAIDTEVFKLGFMRNSEPYFAFHNAGSILAGEELQTEVGISSSLDLKFQLEGFNEPHQLALRYNHDSIVPKRICVVIGKNGVGKSESLKAFCRGALQRKDKGLSLVDSEGRRPKINRIIAIATPGETSNTFPPENKATQKLFYRRLVLTRKGTHNVGDCLVQLARSSDEIGGNSRVELFLKALAETGLDPKEVCVQLKSDRFLSLERFLHGGGEQDTLNWWANVDSARDPKVKKGESFYPLSSGQLTFVKFALLSCLYIENGTFVMMDEPETHMHPNMIVDFIGLLDFLLEKTGSQALIATHSAYFVREVPNEQVVVLSMLEDRVVADRPRLPTFGATVDSISQFVFQEDTEIRLSEKLYDKVKGKKFAEVEQQFGNEISLSALMRLKRMMEA
ncbi:ATP-binding protein [Aestuariibacter halophilus]|uniref:ATP-binding protein n=1 Tax=Fluctibacter halophilus TaxID=226011 RepID=A0ABS8GAB6_9ALTE|nr:AAA family ATPase [Aestuariibacter halophilus]MCC2616171.1 ATP-binding protein [Aestuariibacter halophilus]